MARNKAVPVADYYARLEVHPRARMEVVEAAYKALARVHHPDRGGDEDQFKALAQAHEVLVDAVRRKEYDRRRTPSREHIEPGQIIGQYRVLDKIAAGGFGDTYKAEDLEAPGVFSCIKFCTRVEPEFYDLLVEEAQTMSGLRHYAIPGYRGLIRLEDGSYALAMSYVPGPTLAQVVEKVGNVDPEDVCWIADRILNPLKYMHGEGVVHGDIKPQNLIIQPDKHMVVVLDFGLASVKPTSTSDAKGFTKVFSAPEQMKGTAILPESDFYSLGVTMLFALNGGDMSRVLRREVPNTVPRPLKEFIRSLIVQDVLQRPRWPEREYEEDVVDRLRVVRRESFGREQSNMRPIAGL